MSTSIAKKQYARWKIYFKKNRVKILKQRKEYLQRPDIKKRMLETL